MGWLMVRSSRFDFCPRLLADKLLHAERTYNLHKAAALPGMTAFPETQYNASCQETLYLANWGNIPNLINKIKSAYL